MIVSVVERYTVVSLTGAAGVLAPVTMLTVLELELELDLVPALLRRVMETHVLEAQLKLSNVTISAVSFVVVHFLIFLQLCNVHFYLQTDGKNGNHP